MRTILFWDIDGTLLTTSRAGIFALEDAAEEVTGKKVDLTNLPTAGLTDRRIAASILESAGVDPEASKINQLLDLYATYLPKSLPRRQGRVLTGVKEILDRLKSFPCVTSLLLTGNIEKGAQAKLSYYGLNSYFTHGGFADHGLERAAIAQYALNLSRTIAGDVDLERVYVIGDTPHDIMCCQAIGARAIAVATGSYSLAELTKHNPWWAIPNLPEPDIFLNQLGIFV